jgi:hypothetical protein
MSNPLTYADLDYALVQLGFEKRILEEKHFVYCHRETETLVTFPISEPEEQIRMGHEISARRVIDERGIADAGTFDTLMWTNHLCNGNERGMSMTLTFEVTPEEAKRVEWAKARGFDLNRMVRGLIASLPPSPEGQAEEAQAEAATPEPPLPPEERARIFREWANKPRPEMPILSDEAISRESIYGDRG